MAMEYVEIVKKDGKRLRGFHHDALSDSTVLMFHGFTGSQPGPHFIFHKLSKRLESINISSLRFDFLGSGESDGEFEDMTFLKEVEDAESILDFSIRLGYKNIVLLGLSMGGAVASYLSGKRGNDLEGIVLWSAVGDFSIFSPQYDNEETRNNLNKYGKIDIGGLYLGRNFIEEIKDISVYDKIERFKGGVLIIHGDKDDVVPVDQAYEYKKILGDRAYLGIIKGADHTYNTKTWEDEVLELTIKFLEGSL